jgi:hypothetical protein
VAQPREVDIGEAVSGEARRAKTDFAFTGFYVKIKKYCVRFWEIQVPQGLDNKHKILSTRQTHSSHTQTRKDFTATQARELKRLREENQIYKEQLAQLKPCVQETGSKPTSKPSPTDFGQNKQASPVAGFNPAKLASLNLAKQHGAFHHFIQEVIIYMSSNPPPPSHMGFPWGL